MGLTVISQVFLMYLLYLFTFSIPALEAYLVMLVVLVQLAIAYRCRGEKSMKRNTGEIT